MMQVLPTTFITIEQARRLLPLGLGIKAETWHHYVEQAFMFQLNDIFCDEFLPLIKENIDNSEWSVFFEGGEFEVEGRKYWTIGFRQALTFLAYALYVLDGDVVMTTHGIVRKTNDFSEPVPADERKEMAERYHRNGKSALRSLVDYMAKTGFEAWKVCSKESCGNTNGYYSKVIK